MHMYVCTRHMVSMIERSELLIGISFVPLLSTLNHWPHSFVDMASRSIGRMSETTLVPYPRQFNTGDLDDQNCSSVLNWHQNVRYCHSYSATLISTPLILPQSSPPTIQTQHFPISKVDNNGGLFEYSACPKWSLIQAYNPGRKGRPCTAALCLSTHTWFSLRVILQKNSV